MGSATEAKCSTSRRIFRIADFPQRWPKSTVALCVATLALVGYLDYITGPEFSIALLYLAPVSCAAFYVGTRTALAVAMLGTIVEAEVALLPLGSQHNMTAYLVNTIGQFTMYAVFVFLIAHFRRSLEQHDSRHRKTRTHLTRELARRKHAEDALETARNMEMLGRLAAGAAHDYNNLLTVIAGHLELARTGIHVNENLDMIARTIEVSSEVTRQLLMIGRQQPLKREITSVNTMIGESESLIKTALGGRITLQKDLAADLWPVEVDKSELLRVLINLAINARDAMNGSGQLTLITANSSDSEPSGLGPDGKAACVRIGVRDSGSGIPPELQNRIFEPYFSTKPKGKGTGLGLSTSYSIILHHGGDIRVESVVGSGTTFWINLPRALTAAAKANEPARTPSASTGQHMESNQLLLRHES